jgi:hypothetical protein
MRSEVVELLDVLGVDNDEAIRALLSVFASVQPGPVAAGFRKKSDYGVAPTTAEIRKLYEDADYKCGDCGSHSGLTIEHIDKNRQNIAISNLRVLCASCNRGGSSRPVTQRHPGLRIYKAMISLYRETGKFPTNKEIGARSGVADFSGAYHMVNFFRRKMPDK